MSTPCRPIPLIIFKIIFCFYHKYYFSILQSFLKISDYHLLLQFHFSEWILFVINFTFSKDFLFALNIGNCYRFLMWFLLIWLNNYEYEWFWFIVQFISTWALGLFLLSMNDYEGDRLCFLVQFISTLGLLPLLNEHEW